MRQPAVVLIQPHLLNAELTDQEVTLCDYMVAAFEEQMQYQRHVVAAQVIAMLTGMYITEMRNAGSDSYCALADLAARAQQFQDAGETAKQVMRTVRRKSKTKRKTKARGKTNGV